MNRKFELTYFSSDSEGIFQFSSVENWENRYYFSYWPWCRVLWVSLPAAMKPDGDFVGRTRWQNENVRNFNEALELAARIQGV